MDQATLSRQFDLPTARTFSLSGTAVLSKDAGDDAVDRAFGLPDATAGAVTATSTSRLDQPASRASSALDGDLTTAWDTNVDVPLSQMHVQLPHSETIDHLDLQVVADGRHSIPQSLQIRSDDGEVRIVALPAMPVHSPTGTASAPVSFQPLTGQGFTVVINRVTPVQRSARLMPVGIAELGMPGARRAPMPTQLAATCLPDLITIDGKPFPVRVTGSTEAALAQQLLTMTPCDAGQTVALSAGPHTLRVSLSPHNPTGFDPKRIVLASGPGGGAIPAAALADSGPTTSSGTQPRIHIVSQGRTSMKVKVDATRKPFWLVLGESHNAGWAATADGRGLGPSQLVDGYANGWRVTPSAGGGPMTITVTWTPQRTATISLWISVLAGLACIGIVIAASLRRRRRKRAAPVAEAEVVAPSTVPALIDVFARVGSHFSTAETAFTVGATALVTAVLVRPWVGVLVGALTLLAIRRPRWRLLLRVGPALIVAGITVYMTLGQYLERKPARFDWPTFYTSARTPAWIAVMLLAADALIEIVSRVRDRRIADPTEVGAPEEPHSEGTPDPVGSEL